MWIEVAREQSLPRQEEEVELGGAQGSSKAPSLPRRAAGEGAACGWIRGDRTSPARGPPRRVARRLCAPAAEAKTSKAASGAWAPRSASSACPYHSADRRAPQAAESGGRAGCGRPKAGAGPGSESRAGARARRPPRAPGPDLLPPRRLQGPRVKLPTQSPGAQVPRGLERALALDSMAFWSHSVRRAAHAQRGLI
ncbi:unnamed protein product [Rangifer tarandus platyrhynchus]|uniref:Uncharacterized protein n=1 Tax=Rangifer tarandus platyrhynchus TaxID=3082113 RepID=A0AC59YWF6_RANTA